MSVGNDVVDLDDPESRLGALHPRWADRVFARTERVLLDRAGLRESPGEMGARHRLHWALWAAKESAYKARRRVAPETAFSPREFVVELPPLPEADGVAAGRVVHHGEAYALEVRFDGACLHAVATQPDAVRSRILWQVAVAHGDPGNAVRRLATVTIAAALGLGPERLRIAGRPPTVLRDARPIDAGLSLSHHGRFVAFAATTPSPGAVPAG